MAKSVLSIAGLLHRIARLAKPAKANTLDFNDVDEERGRLLRNVRSELPEAGLTDPEVICLSCFYSRSDSDAGMLDARSVRKSMASMGFERSETKLLIESLIHKGLLAEPSPSRGFDVCEARLDAEATGRLLRLRIHEHAEARFRLPIGSKVRGFSSAAEHLDACLSCIRLLDEAADNDSHSYRRRTENDTARSPHSATGGPLERMERLRADIALREAHTEFDLPLLVIVKHFGLDPCERDMLLMALLYEDRDETCQIKMLQAVLKRDPSGWDGRRRYFTPVSPLFFHSLLRTEHDDHLPFSPRTDVMPQPRIGEYLRKGGELRLQGFGSTLRDAGVSYASNREFIADCLRYAGARWKITASSPRVRIFDEETYSNLSGFDVHADLLDRLAVAKRVISERAEASGRRFPLLQLVDELQLSIEEHEIVLAIMERGVTSRDAELRDVLAFLGGDIFTRRKHRRLLSEDSKLVAKGIVAYDGMRISDRTDVILTPAALERLLDDDADTPNAIIESLGCSHGILRVERAEQSLNDLILPADLKETLHEAAARHRSGAAELLASWGFSPSSGSGMASGGVRMLLSGAPGTGKTFAARALANELERTLLVTDISALLSAWVGDSEKNVRRLFSEYDRIADASPAPPVLLLNECDQFLSRRGTTSERSVDRMYHQMQNLFLEGLERFNGFLVATTNLVESLDDAFSRRFNYKLTFPLPGETERLALWRLHLKPGMPVDEDVDLRKLASCYRFTGGQIAVVIENAAVRAAVRGGRLTMSDLTSMCELEAAGRFDGRNCAKEQVGFLPFRQRR